MKHLHIVIGLGVFLAYFTIAGAWWADGCKSPEQVAQEFAVCCSGKHFNS
jgi:hypothetical protein